MSRFFICFVLLSVPLLASPAAKLHAHEPEASDSGQGFTALRLSFGDAIRMAQDRHVEVLVANERVQQALTRLEQARSVLMPQVTATASQTRQTRNLEAMGIDIPGRDPLVGPFNTFDARVRMTQTLFDASSLKRLRAVRSDQQLSFAEARKAQQDAMALAAALYVEAQRGIEAVELGHALVRDAEERLRIIQTRQKLGMAASLEVQQAQATLAESRQRLRAATAMAEERRLDLTAALGLSRDQRVLYPREEAWKDLPIFTDEEAMAAAQESPEVGVARLRTQQRRDERAVEKADEAPKFSAVADYGASGTAPGSSLATYAFGAQMSLPIFEGGRSPSRVRAASSRIREAEALLADAKQRAEAKTLSAVQSVKQALVTLEAKDAALEVAASELALALERAKIGVGNRVEVVEALTTAALARDQKEEAVATYRMAQVQLAHVLGRMERLAAPEHTR